MELLEQKAPTKKQNRVESIPIVGLNNSDARLLVSFCCERYRFNVAYRQTQVLINTNGIEHKERLTTLLNNLRLSTHQSQFLYNSLIAYMNGSKLHEHQNIIMKLLGCIDIIELCQRLPLYKISFKKMNPEQITVRELRNCITKIAANNKTAYLKTAIDECMNVFDTWLLADSEILLIENTLTQLYYHSQSRYVYYFPCDSTAIATT